eukprot:CAMPEP_0176434310 /NCGR_PEP_ID=MMETSP0127-20121128/16599_1 /TAXON_ID=938130 /ORGANISM="Platyophrya macrostoma, Strain WH" /LENGTH=238 /DNA_ID=CAMNT_0017817019 /DNA_START=82 /DNA_END=798 /DNA_ORIENTATION=-
MIPRVLTRISQSKMQLATLLMKERRKRIRYLGSAWHHYGDRHWVYGCLGGVRNGSKLIVSRTHSRHQFWHPQKWSNTYSVRQVKTKATAYDGFGGYMRDRSIGQPVTSNLYGDVFKKNFRGMNKDEAIEIMEQWGMKFVVMDELRKPSVVDTMYWKHKLYSHNFPYIRDPVTNARKGDADYSWKGVEKFDYSQFGATTKCAKNDFTSLWRLAAADVAAADSISIKAKQTVKAAAAKQL